jgi:2-keto-3-deoxy-L-rhamnonate aldolase RhmA
VTSNDDRFGARLSEGRALFGSWCNFASFASVELMASLGLDFVVLDTQHAEITAAHFPALLGAFARARTRAVVRVARNEPHAIGWLLDQGVEAILVPLVNSPADARRAVEAAKFPPLGRRSFGPFRASGYGRDVAGYMDGADRRTTLIVQVEDAATCRGIDEILAVPGVDAVFLGPNDIALSRLEPGQSFADLVARAPAGTSPWTGFARTPEVLALCDHVRARCQARGVPFGMTAGSAEEARSWLERGARFVTFGSDFMFMRAGAQRLVADWLERS